VLLLEGESDVYSVEEDSEARECSLRVGLLSESLFTGWGERELALKEGAVGGKEASNDTYWLFW
jgi:hypothetical protein